MEELLRRIRVARGETPPDLVLKNGSIINVFSGEIQLGDIAISDGVIAGIGSYDGPEVEDLRGRYVAPGFMDGHFHIESTMLTPAELARAVLPHGTTAIFADPHELCNVLGVRGLTFLIEASQGLPVDFFFMLPSCVPATHLETAGAELSLEDLTTFCDEPRVLGLAEMMNFPGVIRGVPEVVAKVARFRHRIIDGHAPFLSGQDLNAYITVGIASDHECTALGEAREKLRLGMHIFIREGTQAKNLAALLPVVTPWSIGRCSLVTDDLHPHDISHHGHLDALINKAIQRGLDPVGAISMVTINTARYFGFRDRGAVAPGWKADLVILSDLTPLRVAAVFKNGVPVVRDGEVTTPIRATDSVNDLASMKVAPYGPAAFDVPAGGRRVRVIDLIPDQILTGSLIVDAPVMNGRLVSDIPRDILKIAVIERHRRTGNIAVGLVRGFGLKRGALASTVAHDSHNIICVGVDDNDLYGAAKAVEEMRGGYAVVCEGRTTASLPLPIGGLMADRPLADVASGWENVRGAARDLGCSLEEPFMQMSFLALPVIPMLKITDRGLVDVNGFAFTPLFVD